MDKYDAIDKVSKVLPKTISIRIDIDTLVGLKKGVPPILDLFERENIHGTFFCVMGPDTMGQHMKRFKKGSYWKRILKVNPIRLVQKYGIKSFFYGTLLKSPRIAGDHPNLIKAVEDRGNEIICHGYNHAGWADDYEKYTLEEMKIELHKSFEVFNEVTGRYPHAAGVPNWRTNYQAVQICEEFGGFEYLADVRGDVPFKLIDDDKEYKCTQVPITMATTHERLQADRKRAEIIPELINELNEGYNVFCIHDWFEGLYNMDFVEDFISLAKAKGYEFITMQEAVKRIEKSGIELPKNKIGNKPLAEGGVKLITHQLWT